MIIHDIFRTAERQRLLDAANAHQHPYAISPVVVPWADYPGRLEHQFNSVFPIKDFVLVMIRWQSKFCFARKTRFRRQQTSEANRFKYVGPGTCVGQRKAARLVIESRTVPGLIAAPPAMLPFRVPSLLVELLFTLRRT